MVDRTCWPAFVGERVARKVHCGAVALVGSTLANTHELVTVAGASIGRLTLEPGWRWSNDVKPIAKTEWCEAPHFQYQISGRLHGKMADGTEIEMRAPVFKQYGEAAIQVVQHEPYRLARDIYGIGFKTADKIARQLGMPADSPARIQAGLLYTLSQLSDEGHCFATQPQLIEAAAGILELAPAVAAATAACQDQLASLVQQNEVISEDDGKSIAIYLPPFYRAELGVANKLRRIQSAAHDRLQAFRALDWDKAFAWIDETNAIRLTEQQKAAIRMALTEKVSILTGGPGTGKSTITGSLIRLLKTRGSSVLLAAPTGRAAKRLSEATGLEAKTIHRLLEFKPAAGNQFVRDQENPLDSDLVIVDETSMVDILLMNHLLNAIDVGCHLLLVGDVDQLPSVGPGNVLRDLIALEYRLEHDLLGLQIGILDPATIAHVVASVGGASTVWMVGESGLDLKGVGVFHVAAQPLVRVLHHENIERLLLHLFPNRPPPTLQLLI